MYPGLSLSARVRASGVCAFATIVLLASCTMSGCFEWTHDPQGDTTSFGIPGAGAPIWQAKNNPPPLSPTDAGMTPEEAAKVGGPVLVWPPSATVKTWRYRYYLAGQNHCQDDLNKILADRAQNGETGDTPYCSSAPGAPGNKAAFVLF